MEEIRLVVSRNMTPSAEDKVGQERLHRERAHMLHNLVDVLNIPVANWGNTDSAESHEVIEIIIALGSAGVFTALVAIIKAWLDQNRILRVELVGPAGHMILDSATALDVVSIAKQIGFTIVK